jgi:type IV pilus assembly protein PilM
MPGGKTKSSPQPKAVAIRAPRPSGGSFVGLDIGSQTIKVVEVTGSGSGLRVTAFGMDKTPLGTISQGVVTDPKTLGAAIKALLNKSGVKARGKCVSAASGAAAVVVRVIEVPKMSLSELAETMKWEVERHIPFSATDVEMSYQKIDDPVVDADEANPNMEVLLACAQRDMVFQHLETLKAAGLTPVAIDVEPLAVGRALINLSSQGLKDKNVVVVNLGASMTDVGIFKQATLRFPRTIPLGGDNFTQAVADRLGLPMDAAEDEKKQNGKIFMDLVNQPNDGGIFGAPPTDAGVSSPFDVDLAAPLPPSLYGGGEGGGEAEPAPAGDNPFDISYDNPFDTPVAAAPAAVPETAPVPEDPRTTRQKEVFYALSPVLGEFVMELQRSIDYFKSRYPTENIDQVLLCGGSALIPGLADYVQYQTGLTAVVADPFAGVNVTARQVSLDARAQMAPALAVAMGLATRDAVLGAGR